MTIEELDQKIAIINNKIHLLEDERLEYKIQKEKILRNERTKKFLRYPTLADYPSFMNYEIDAKTKTTLIIKRFFDLEEKKYLIIENVFKRVFSDASFTLSLVVAKRFLDVNHKWLGKNKDITFTDLKPLQAGSLQDYLITDEYKPDETDRCQLIKNEIFAIPQSKFQKGGIIAFSIPIDFYAQDTALYESHTRECELLYAVGVKVINPFRYQ